MPADQFVSMPVWQARFDLVRYRSSLRVVLMAPDGRRVAALTDESVRDLIAHLALLLEVKTSQRSRGRGRALVGLGDVRTTSVTSGRHTARSGRAEASSATTKPLRVSGRRARSDASSGKP